MANNLFNTTVVPEALPAGAYTHLNFAFAYINPDTFEVAPMSESDMGLYSRFTGLKEDNTGLETWISIGTELWIVQVNFYC